MYFKDKPLNHTPQSSEQIMKVLFVTIAFAVAMTATTCASKEEVEQDCVCIEIYYPVCASNGETFENICWFDCAQKEDPSLAIVHLGKCQDQ